MSTARDYSAESLGALRIMTAALMIVHGTTKLFAWPFPGPGGRVQIASLMGAAGVLEAVGGLLVLIGLLSRPVAFVLAGEMAVAYFMAHATDGFWPIRNGGELAIMFCFALLAIAGNGPGAWALDGRR
jgi:putative oxidoreductase